MQIRYASRRGATDVRTWWRGWRTVCTVADEPVTLRVHPLRGVDLRTYARPKLWCRLLGHRDQIISAGPLLDDCPHPYHETVLRCTRCGQVGNGICFRNDKLPGLMRRQAE